MNLEFQSTLPRRERQNLLCCRLIFTEHFNPRSREGSDTAESKRITGWRNFNPRSREGSDCSAQDIHRWHKISIHAPAKGATICPLYSQALFRFQSTLPRRERPVLLLPVADCMPISIHAPAKGATKYYGSGCGQELISIHAPAKGATLLACVCKKNTAFQSTLPRRERLFILFPFIFLCDISIHAPAKGATRISIYSPV